MTNLWEETIAILDNTNRTFDDVIYICGDDFIISKENFQEVAKETNYYAGYGSQKIACDLKIFGRDFIMTRGEYDGSEWWNFEFTEIKIPKKLRKIKRLAFEYSAWDTLKEINDEEYVEEINKFRKVKVGM